MTADAAAAEEAKAAAWKRMDGVMICADTMHAHATPAKREEHRHHGSANCAPWWSRSGSCAAR